VGELDFPHLFLKRSAGIPWPGRPIPALTENLIYDIRSIRVAEVLYLRRAVKALLRDFIIIGLGIK